MGNDDLITPVILSGGSGTRLWPLSTDEKPKQFLDLIGTNSMFQMTLQRCEQKELFEAPIIVGSARHEALANEQMREIGITPQAVILEPCARNTAPAIALAAIACKNPHGLMLVMPSDHVIGDVEKFRKAVEMSVPIARARWLVTFGIQPAGPETGYGYIQRGDPVVGSENSFAAKRFVEKPIREKAETMIAEGGYSWNAGIFLFRADTYLAALDQFAPEMLTAARSAMEKAERDGAKIHPDQECFARAPSDSIDYAVMEKAEKVALTPMDPNWSDVGSWDSLYQIKPDDEQSNVTSGKVTAIDSNHNLLHADGIEVATFGVENLIVVATGEKIMILPRGQSQNVKQILAKIQENSDSS